MSATITNGSVKYGETRKTGDFENKRADVELSFSLPDGADVDEAIKQVIRQTKTKCFELLGVKPEALTSEALKVSTTEETKAVKPAKPKAPKMPESPSAEKEEKAVANPAEISEPVTPANAVEDLEDVLGSKTITDAELMDATTKQQEEVKNPAAIRKLITECGVKCPPGRLIDIAQDKRQQYLDGLKTIKPLA